MTRRTIHIFENPHGWGWSANIFKERCSIYNESHRAANTSELLEQLRIFLEPRPKLLSGAEVDEVMEGR